MLMYGTKNLILRGCTNSNFQTHKDFTKSKPRSSKVDFVVVELQYGIASRNNALQILL